MTVPDYEITIAGRMGPVVASCLPGHRCVARPATVLHVLVSNHHVVPELLGLLVEHHLTLVDVRIHPASTGPLVNPTCQPTETAKCGANPQA